RVARHAPDLPTKLLAVDIVTPSDLVAHNPNAVGGDPYGGSAELDQSLLWRPLPAASRHSTPIPGLSHIGASPHPGAGLRGPGPPRCTPAHPDGAPAAPPLTASTKANAAAASTTGSDHAHSPRNETAVAPATQPAKKPTRTPKGLFTRSLSSSVSG